MADRTERIEEIRAAVGRCSRPEPGTSEWHRRELLNIVDNLTSHEPAPLELTLYVVSAEELFDLEEPITPPAGHGVLVLCAPMDTIRTLTDEEPHAVRVGFVWGGA